MRAPRATAWSQASRTRAPAPSVMTNPSRRASKGREIPEVDRAVMLEKAARPTPVIPASAAPPMATSQRPEATSRAAWAMLWAPAAHAVVIGLGRAVPPQPDGDGGRSGIGHHHRDQTGRHSSRSLLAEDEDLGLQRLQSAHAGTHHHARAARVGVDLAGIVQGHGRHGHGELGEAVELAGLLGRQPALGVEVGGPPLALRGRTVEPVPQGVGPDHRSTRRPPCR